MKWLSLLLFLSCSAFAKQIRVAVIDTGFDFKSKWENASSNDLSVPKLCNEGHKDFTGFGIQDNQGHGTHIAGLIAKGNDKSKYCLIIYKFYHQVKLNEKFDTIPPIINAYKEILSRNDIDIVNLSLGGETKNEEECELIRSILDKGIEVVAALGNEGKNVGKIPYYPAMCDSRILRVRNVDSKGERVPSSNFGGNSIPRNGQNLLSLALDDSYAIMTGTSQATAVRTSEMIREYNNVCNKQFNCCEAQ